MQPSNNGFENIWNRAHVAAGEYPDRFRITMFDEQIEILQRHLLVFFAVDDQHRRAGFCEPALIEQRERRHYGAKLVESFLAEEIGAGFDEIKKIGVGVARAR